MSCLKELGGENTTKWNDAEVIGDLNEPAMQALLDRNACALVGKTSKQKRGTWRIWSTSLREMLELKLTRHEARSRKDGDSMVFANAISNGELEFDKNGGLHWQLCARTRGKIQSITFAGFDIDDGEPLELVKKRLKALGKFSILYTTHSHGKRHPKTGEVVNKYRILFPLEAPFELSPECPDEHSFLCAFWRDWLIRFAQEELGLTIDESGCDVNRLFYTPRHKPKDVSWDLTIFTGPALSIGNIPEKPMKIVPRRGSRGKDFSKVTLPKRPRPILSDGFDLIDWRRDWGRQFKVREFFECIQWDFGQDDPIRREARILCPNDLAHSSTNDRQGCWIKDGTGGECFALHCHHNSCREAELGALELLAALELDAGLPDECETLSEFLCDPIFYDADIGGHPSPEHNRYVRWDPRQENEAITAGAVQ